MGDVRRSLAAVVLLSVLLAFSLSIVAAASPISVVGNILAESIINTSKGARINKAITKFKAGTVADFDSLTQFLIADAGMYTMRLEIAGPDKQLRAYYDFMVEATSADWIHSQLIHWRAVGFDQAGVYQFVVRMGKKVIASFPISASN